VRRCPEGTKGEATKQTVVTKIRHISADCYMSTVLHLVLWLIKARKRLAGRDGLKLSGGHDLGLIGRI